MSQRGNISLQGEEELVEKVAEMLWPDETRPPGEATKQLAKEVIAFIAKREREAMLREFLACLKGPDNDPVMFNTRSLIRAFARAQGIDL